jgi:tetratricopeptide (TPR) repeat protein
MCLSHSRMSLRIFVVSAAMLAALILDVRVSSARQEQLTADQAAARAKLDEGVQAYRKGKFDEATDDFKQAKEKDPSLLLAMLYLGTTYASEYIPGAASQENERHADLALDEFRDLLRKVPATPSTSAETGLERTAIDAIASILYNKAATPFDTKTMGESKAYYEKHIHLWANDPEPYYWIGVIDWSIAYHAEQQKRVDWTKRTGQTLAQDQMLPELARDEFGNEYGDTIDEGIGRLKKALELRPDYDDAMAYLNLIYRLKADTENSPQARDEDIKAADELVDKVKEIRQARASSQQQKQ